MKTYNQKKRELLYEGFKKETLANLNEKQIHSLHKRIFKEAVYNIKKGGNLPDPDKLGPNDVVNIEEDEINEEEVLEALFGKPKKKNKPINNLGMFEGEIKEKFKSKSQQRLFYAKCKEEGPKSKWCKMAKEFSDDTKDFKSLPEKVSEEEKIRQIEESIVSLIKRDKNKVLTKKDILREAEPRTVPKVPTIKPGTKPERGTPYSPKHSPKPKAGTEVKPAQPKVDPGTKPERGTPYSPKHSPKPKAGNEGGLPEFLTFKNLNIKFRDE
jgi:hypothetical protein